MDPECCICEAKENLQLILEREHEEILPMLRSISSLPITNDYLRQNICLQCSHDLKETYSFKLLYAATVTKLENMLLFPKKYRAESPLNIDINEYFISRETKHSEMVHSKKNRTDEKSRSHTDAEVKMDDPYILEKKPHAKDSQKDNLKRIEAFTCKERMPNEVIQTIITKTQTPSDHEDSVHEGCDEICVCGKKTSPQRTDAREEFQILFLESGGSQRPERTKTVSKIIDELENGDVTPKDGPSVNSREAPTNASLSRKNSGLYKCDVCGKTFKYQCRFRQHKFSHSSVSNECDECGKLFTKSVSFKVHLALHKNPHLHKCDKCGKIFKHQQSLNKHRFSHSDLNECGECGKSFGTLESLKVHETLHKNPDRYKCDKCGKCLTSARVLRKHQFSHSSDSAECDECGKSFRTLHSFKVHKALHKNPDLYKCDKCGKVFKEQRTLNEHRFSHSDLNECGECGKSFDYLRTLKVHVALHKNPDRYKCDKCGKSLMSLSGLKRHNCLHSDSKECNECGKSFRSLHSFNDHTALHKNPDVFKCDECGQVFTRERRLKEHKFSHSVLNNCVECGKSFSALHLLKVHIALHKNPDLYKCDECGKVFKNKISLRAHKFSHSGRNKCIECGKSYASLHLLQSHIALHKNPDLYKCDKCCKTFSDQRCLNAHKCSLTFKRM